MGSSLALPPQQLPVNTVPDEEAAEPPVVPCT